jgi:predicted DNA-binding transcriptional regulator AlpA
MVRRPDSHTEAAVKEQTPTQRALLPIPEVRAILGGIANATVYKLINDGTLPTVKVGKRRFATPDGIRACVENLERLK